MSLFRRRGHDAQAARAGVLNPEFHEAALAWMTDPTTELDVLVVGGGVVGTGIALDAVTRGLSTGLLEQRDFASGTSSRSSKLVHGGLRYLEMLDFALVREALQERGLLLTTLAPHLVRPVPFIYPLTHRYWERPYVGAGLLMYDAMAAFGANSGFIPGRMNRMGVPRHRHLTRTSLSRIAPDLNLDNEQFTIRGGIQYHDAQVDDARLVLTLARTAAANGAHLATRVKVTGFLRSASTDAGDSEDRIVGVTARDLAAGKDLEIRAKVVINAAGVWTDQIQEMAGGLGALHVQASKGIHLVVPRDRIRSESGFIIRTEKSVLFVIPWRKHWIIGTTDTPWTYDLAHPAASRADIEYLLDHVNKYLREPLGHEDVEGVYAGLRPLLRGESDATAKISREHTVVNPVPGLVLIAGGKLTTYRVMAKDAVDMVGEQLHQPSTSITDQVPLLGASGFRTRSNQRALLARQSGLPVARIDHLLGRYGALIDDLLELMAVRPELAQPLEGAEDYLAAEVVYAVTHEGARYLDDVLIRRTRIWFETFDRGTAAAPQVAALMGAELDWDRKAQATQVDHYLRRVEAERSAQGKMTDEEADENRVASRFAI